MARGCQPIKENLPKVGAIIVKSGEVIGRGRRGNGIPGDDEHAEWNAIGEVEEKSKLAGSTLYTTLEPCTAEVRRIAEDSCSELIRQYQFSRVFIGILDPNQGVAGKGLLRLQDGGVEVALFPHDLSLEIRALNAEFIRSQQSLSATILEPEQNAILKTYETGGRTTVRFESLNPPTSDTFLLSCKGGVCWPQPGPIRQVAGSSNRWEIDAHFGSTGDHTLQLISVNDLGRTLIQYYRKIVDGNLKRRDNLKGKIDLQLLGGDYPGIAMNGLPKGLRLEASVVVKVSHKVELIGSSIETRSISRGQALAINYEIESSEEVPPGIWLGASFQSQSRQDYFNQSEDRGVSLSKGRCVYTRVLTPSANMPPGEYFLLTNIWQGEVGNSRASRRLMGAPPITVKIR